MTWLIIIAYVFAAFGFCNMVAFGSGPFRIFERIREWSENISEHFGLLNVAKIAGLPFPHFTCLIAVSVVKVPKFHINNPPTRKLTRNSRSEI